MQFSECYKRMEYSISVTTAALLFGRVGRWKRFRRRVSTAGARSSVIWKF
jgi:hypothetical protein